MKNPLISILIPFKNVDAFFEECLVSIQHQEYKNWEVIAVNDHSTDTSLNIAQQFSKNDSRFKILTNQDAGIITALRKAYTYSNGNYITRMDADDIMTKNRLSTMINALLEEGKGTLAIGQVHYFSEHGVNEGYRKYERWLNRLTAAGSNFKEIYKECVIPSPCWMVDRNDFDACNGFDEDRYPEDYDLAFRFYEQGLRCIPCSETLHHWRDYQTRTSRTSEHYAQNYFLELKLYYFLKLEHDPSKTIVVWGAGKKGKQIAKSLVDKKMDFKWICNNPNKIGKDIYSTRLRHYSELEHTAKSLTIITVANEDEQKSIRSYLQKIGKIATKDFYFFC